MMTRMPFSFMRIGLYGFWVGVIVLSINAARLSILSMRLQEVPTTTARPYTVTLRETVTDPGGAAKRGIDLTIAVRADGSQMMRIEEDAVEHVVSDRILDFASGIQVRIDDLGEMKSSTLNGNRSAVEWLRDPNSDCVSSLAGKPITSGQIVIGYQEIEGNRAVVIRHQGSTWWFALDYGCAMLRSIKVFGGQSRSEKHLIALIPGEPQPALFHVPESFREVPPSEMYLARVPIAESSTVSRSLKLDKYYYKHRLR